MPEDCPKAGGMHLPPLLWVPTLEQRTLEPCCQRGREQVHDRQPLVEKILDHLLV